MGVSRAYHYLCCWVWSEPPPRQYITGTTSKGRVKIEKATCKNLNLLIYSVELAA